MEYILGVVAYGYVVGILIWTLVLIVSMEKEGFIYSAIPSQYKGPLTFGVLLLFEVWTKTEAVSHIFWDQLLSLVLVLVPSFWISEERL